MTQLRLSYHTKKGPHHFKYYVNEENIEDWARGIRYCSSVLVFRLEQHKKDNKLCKDFKVLQHYNSNFMPITLEEYNKTIFENFLD